MAARLLAQLTRSALSTEQETSLRSEDRAASERVRILIFPAEWRAELEYLERALAAQLDFRAADSAD